jgi:hypothetical protein
MRSLISLSLLTLCLVACATLPATARTPFLPAGVYGTYQDNDVGAINQSAWAFASPANTRGNPIDAARAVIALEYLPGELRENPRWIMMRTGVDLHLERARDQLRQILGIRSDAPSQMVVNTLVALNLALQMSDESAAMHALASPVFTQAPQRTLQLLSNLPYVQEANLATSQLENQMLSSSMGGG